MEKLGAIFGQTAATVFGIGLFLQFIHTVRCSILLMDYQSFLRFGILLICIGVFVHAGSETKEVCPEAPEGKVYVCHMTQDGTAERILLKQTSLHVIAISIANS